MSELDLEKGFNESELEDIMSEIESLEKDFGDVSEDVSAEVEEVIDEVEPEVEEIIEEPLMEEEFDEIEQIIEEEPVAEVVPEETFAEIIPEGPAMEEREEMESMLEAEFEEPEDFTPADELKIAPEAVVRSPVQTAIEDEVDAMIYDQAEEFEPEAEVVEMKQPEMKPVGDVHETKMDFSVSGQMNLKLNFWVNGQSIELHVSEEEGFVIEMEGGAKFSLPVGNKKAS